MSRLDDAAIGLYPPDGGEAYRAPDKWIPAVDDPQYDLAPEVSL